MVYLSSNRLISSNYSNNVWKKNMLKSITTKCKCLLDKADSIDSIPALHLDLNAIPG